MSDFYNPLRSALAGWKPAARTGWKPVFRLLAAITAAAAGMSALAEEAALPEKISFNRDIRPILSDNCFNCHGPDKNTRKADLRLDQRESALEEREGIRAIVPGDLKASELMLRVLSHDADEVMPPPKSDRKLTTRQTALLRRWIEQGAEWEPHWAFVPPQRAEPPPATSASWARNSIDRFLLARIEAAGLKPSPEADRATLLRRVSYDLTGLPPKPHELEDFLADTAPDAFERAVDRLLASPRFGEKMAVHWLDLSRYADTHGYHLDSGREMWKWREWVIEAFNRNLPFDQFILWQLAGDLLPEATTEQKLATGFVRNNMINFEGGAIPEEYLTQYVFDRVNTTGTAFLGLTVACAQCHDHKFDPISQREYYQLYAYFNAVPEKGLDGRAGNAEPLLQLPSSEQKEKLDQLAAAVTRAERRLAQRTKAADAEQLVWENSISPADIENVSLANILQTPSAERSEGEQETLRKHYRDKVSQPLRDATARLEQVRTERETLQKSIPTVMVMQQMEKPRDTFILKRGQYDQFGEKVEPGTPASLPPLPVDAPPNRLGLARWLIDPQHPLTARVAVNRFWKNIMGAGLVKTLNDFGAQSEWPTHPDLLDWLATEFVGSGWDVKQLTRLIVTSAAYRQSAKVTPELRERDPENQLYARGPRFRLSAEEIRDTALAVSGLLNPKIGGPSVLPYQPEGLWEELSSRKDSGNWTAQKFVQSKGADLYRRSMYTFWKRTSPPPQLQTFDAPDREVCVVSRERTNTPLQALVLMNDPTYAEASRLLAERMMREGGATPAERVSFAFRLTTARPPDSREAELLLELFAKQKERYTPQMEEAVKLLSAGEHPRDERLDAVELAAWTIVASTILNLDEVVTKG